MSDIEIDIISIASKYLGIDSEMLRFAKVKKDYSAKLPKLVQHARYRSRRRTLREWVMYRVIWSEGLTGSRDPFIVDSIPTPACYTRHQTSRAIWKRRIKCKDGATRSL